MVWPASRLLDRIPLSSSGLIAQSRMPTVTAEVHRVASRPMRHPLRRIPRQAQSRDKARKIARDLMGGQVPLSVETHRAPLIVHALCRAFCSLPRFRSFISACLSSGRCLYPFTRRRRGSISRSAAATHLCLWGELFDRLTFRVRSPVMLLSASMQLVVRKLRFRNGEHTQPVEGQGFLQAFLEARYGSPATGIRVLGSS